MRKTTERTDFSKISENGWRQGCCLSITTDHNLLDKNGTALKKGLYILISQDCDILNFAPEKEPYIELLFIELKNINGDLTHGKNPRKLHIRVNQDKEKYGECLPYNRVFLRKENLINLSPHQDIQVKDKDLRVLITWLGKRYSRSAFPDTFNKRTKDISKKIRNIIEKYAINSRGLYLRLNTEKELSEEEIYKLEFYLLIDPKEFEESKEQLYDGLEQIYQQLSNVPGIAIIKYALRTTQEINVYEFEELKPLDFDYLSFSE